MAAPKDVAPPRAAAPPGGARFTTRQRIRRRSEYRRIYDTGRKIHGRYMTLFILPNDLGDARLGIAATRKLGGAVMRNLAKRRIREVFRTHRPAAGADVVVVPRREFFDAPLPALVSDFEGVLARYDRKSTAPRRPESHGRA